jgi:hypothetical protein
MVTSARDARFAKLETLLGGIRRLNWRLISCDMGAGFRRSCLGTRHDGDAGEACPSARDVGLSRLGRPQQRGTFSVGCAMTIKSVRDSPTLRRRRFSMLLAGAVGSWPGVLVRRR